LAKTDFFRTLIKDIPDTSIAIDAEAASETSGFIDTNCYVLNAAFSGTLFGGMPNNKVLTLAGESSTGKTFFSLGLVDSYLRQHPDGGCIFFDTEQAITNEMFVNRGIDLKRIMKSEPQTVEQFRTRAVNILNRYMEQKPEDRKPLIMVLDSLGGLSTEKEAKDVAEGNNVRDMTRAQLLRGTFRVLRPILAKAGVALIVTNHTYEVVGAYVPTKKMGGGSGLSYMSDTIAFLGKKKDRDSDKNVVGNIITVKMEKSRLSRESTQVEVKLSFTRGLDRYYGLLELAEESGLVTRQGNRVKFPNGEMGFPNAVYKTPEKFFTPEFLKQLDEEYIAKNFRYLSLDEEVANGESDDEDTDN
jgi:RecA/RadA recombinase